MCSLREDERKWGEREREREGETEEGGKQVRESRMMKMSAAFFFVT